MTEFGAISDPPHIKSYSEVVLLNLYIPTFQGAVPTCAVLPLLINNWCPTYDLPHS
jgi:hypothetical protein